MKIYIGSDHAGFELKEYLKDFLKSESFDFEDLGNSIFDSEDDYPDFAEKVAEAVSENPGTRGMLVCGSGVGMCIVANKTEGIRAVNAQSVDIAQKSREHNDTNILCLGQNYIERKLAGEIARVWLNTDFSGEERHLRRVRKIK